MHWLYLLFAFGALLLAVTTTHAWLLALCLVAVVVLFAAWALTLYQRRVGSGGRDALGLIDQAELQRMRELAQSGRQTGDIPLPTTSEGRTRPPTP